MTEPEPETITDIEVLEEAVLSVFVAFAQQLDIDQLLIDLLHQRETIAECGRPRAEDVLRLVDRVGLELTHIDALRESRRTPSH